jgi:muramoyltetrapeptide carboxypeptidase
LTYEKKIVILRLMKHIRIISPSGVITPEFILRTQTCLEEKGYRVSIGKNSLQQYGRFAGIKEQRLSDINEALADPSIDIILCSRGGYGLQQIVDKIQLPIRPKEQWPLIVGYSDITILHSLMALHGVLSLHAPMCKELKDINLSGYEDIRFITNKGRIGKSEAKIIGGNLSVLYGLQGTSWDLNNIIDTIDHAPILLIEDIAESHYHIDRMMNNLRLSGVLGRISGLVVGHFTDCTDDDRMGCSIKETILQSVSEYDYPVMFDAPIGHESPNIPILLGGYYLLEITSHESVLKRSNV